MQGGRKLFLLFVIMGALYSLKPSVGLAAPWETLSPDHWAYEEIRWLQVLGYLQELNPSHKPYTRGEIAAALSGESAPEGEPARGRYDLLLDEFAPETAGQEGWEAFAGARSFAGFEAEHGREGREAGYGILTAGVGNARLGIHTTLRADLDLVEDDNYRGKVWNEVAGLTESAYFVAIGNKHRWELKFGRDHRYWGPGDDHLLLNHAPRGLDQISFRVRWGWGEFTALVGQLDDFEDLTSESLATGVRTSRFLSAHRIELLPWNWLRIGLSETLLFTGDVRLGSMNPFLPYYGELVNENSEGNGLFGLDFITYPHAGFEVFGELLLDDVQIEQEKPEDLEPAEWGWLIGCRWAGMSGRLGAGVTYSGITNRTYNAIEPRYRYLNYGLPLGSELGNDGDRLQLTVSSWPQAWLRLYAFWDFRRLGEGRVTVPFDTSYMSYTIDEGYSEPFPTGIVEKKHTLGIGLSALQQRYFQLEGWIGHDWITDAFHIPDQKEEGFRGRITLNIRFDHLTLYP